LNEWPVFPNNENSLCPFWADHHDHHDHHDHPMGRRPDMQGRLDWGYGIQLSNNVKKRVDSDNNYQKTGG
jgi:hypothetical protein